MPRYHPTCTLRDVPWHRISYMVAHSCAYPMAWRVDTGCGQGVGRTASSVAAAGPHSWQGDFARGHVQNDMVCAAAHTYAHSMAGDACVGGSSGAAFATPATFLLGGADNATPPRHLQANDAARCSACGLLEQRKRRRAATLSRWRGAQRVCSFPASSGTTSRFRP